jgi:hypothetical protein
MMNQFWAALPAQYGCSGLLPFQTNESRFRLKLLNCEWGMDPGQRGKPRLKHQAGLSSFRTRSPVFGHVSPESCYSFGVFSSANKRQVDGPYGLQDPQDSGSFAEPMCLATFNFRHTASQSFSNDFSVPNPVSITQTIQPISTLFPLAVRKSLNHWLLWSATSS